MLNKVEKGFELLVGGIIRVLIAAIFVPIALIGAVRWVFGGVVEKGVDLVIDFCR